MGRAEPPTYSLMRPVSHIQRYSRSAFGLSTALLTIALILPGSEIQAQTTAFKQRAPDGSILFSDVPARNGRIVRTSYKGTPGNVDIINPCKGLSIADLDARAQQLDAQFINAAGLTGADVNLLKAIARAESCFDPLAVSRAGAKGLMQLMPRTARSLGIADIHDIEQNLYGGALYLVQMLERYFNDLDTALAAYNAGPGNVDRYGGIPPFRETRRYIRSVKKFKALYQSQITMAEQLAEAP